MAAPAAGARAGRRVYASDIGSTRADRGRRAAFGWAWVDPQDPVPVAGGACIDALARAVASDLAAGVHVALGFEAPLFIPVPEVAAGLCRGRPGESNRAFAAPAGASVATLGVHQSAWVLAAVRARLAAAGGALPAAVHWTADVEAWPPAVGSVTTLFCWEAFVSGPAHAGADRSHGGRPGETGGAGRHVRDAATAVAEFLAREGDLAAANAVTAERPLSLLGAAALWAGWSSDLGALRAPALVVRPGAAYLGPLQVAGGAAA